MSQRNNVWFLLFYIFGGTSHNSSTYYYFYTWKLMCSPFVFMSTTMSLLTAMFLSVTGERSNWAVFMYNEASTYLILMRVFFKAMIFCLLHSIIKCGYEWWVCRFRINFFMAVLISLSAKSFWFYGERLTKDYWMQIISWFVSLTLCLSVIPRPWLESSSLLEPILSSCCISMHHQFWYSSKNMFDFSITYLYLKLRLR